MDVANYVTELTVVRILISETIDDGEVSIKQHFLIRLRSGGSDQTDKSIKAQSRIWCQIIMVSSNALLLVNHCWFINNVRGHSGTLVACGLQQCKLAHYPCCALFFR